MIHILVVDKTFSRKLNNCASHSRYFRCKGRCSRKSRRYGTDFICGHRYAGILKNKKRKTVYTA